MAELVVLSDISASCYRTFQRSKGMSIVWDTYFLQLDFTFSGLSRGLQDFSDNHLRDVFLKRCRRSSIAPRSRPIRNVSHSLLVCQESLGGYSNLSSTRDSCSSVMPFPAFDSFISEKAGLFLRLPILNSLAIPELMSFWVSRRLGIFEGVCTLAFTR